MSPFPKNKFLLISVIPLFIFINGCGTRKKTGEISSGSVTNLNKNSFFVKLDSCRTKYHTLVLKGTVSVERGGEKNKFNYRICMLKDSIVWATAGLFGIEGGRILITKDSLKYMNRLEKSYLVSDFSPAKNMIGMDVTLSQLQEILTGSMPGIAQKPKLQINETQAEVRYEQGKSDLSFILDKRNLKMLQAFSTLKNDTNITKTFVTNSEFKTVSGQLLPFVTKISVESDNNKQIITFNHSEIQVNPLDLKLTFNIPADYERIFK